MYGGSQRVDTLIKDIIIEGLKDYKVDTLIEDIMYRGSQRL